MPGVPGLQRLERGQLSRGLLAHLYLDGLSLVSVAVCFHEGELVGEHAGRSVAVGRDPPGAVRRPGHAIGKVRGGHAQPRAIGDGFPGVEWLSGHAVNV